MMKRHLTLSFLCILGLAAFTAPVHAQEVPPKAEGDKARQTLPGASLPEVLITHGFERKDPNRPKPLGKVKAEMLIEPIKGDVGLYFSTAPATSPGDFTLYVDTYGSEVKPGGTTAWVHLLSQVLTTARMKEFLAQPNVLKPMEHPERLDDERKVYRFTVQTIPFKLTERSWYELCQVIRRAAEMAEK